MQFYWFMIGVLGVWRLCHLLTAEAGPGGILERTRRKLRDNIFGDLIRCFYCLSVWVSALFAFFLSDAWKGRLLLWPALSGAAVLIERTFRRETFASAPIYYEDQEEPDVLREQPSEQIRYS